MANIEKYWKHPERFDIYRWDKQEIEKNQKNNHPFAYVPFWAGP